MENKKKKDFIRTSLGIATAQICQSLGWHSVQRSSHDILTDVLERYISQVSKTAAVISQTCCRTVPNLDDVSLAFKQLGIHIHELQDYIQQVESSPAVKPSSTVPLESDTPQCLLNFSGEDFLPPRVDVTIKEEIQVKEEELEENDATNLNGDAGRNDRPKNLSFRTDSVESPPYSPLEPKSLNLNAFHSVDLTRPDLKVTTPKGYTPTLTTQSLVAGIASMTNSVAKSSPSNEKKITPPNNKSSKSDTKSTKKEKKEKKESHNKKNDKNQSNKTSLFSPSSVKSESSGHTPSPKPTKPSKSQSPVISPKEKEKAIEREKEAALLKEREKEKERELAKEREKERERELAKETEREKERKRELDQLEKEKNDFDDDSSPVLLDTSSPPPSPPPFLLHKRDSPSSLLFSPPRMRIASYQSDKKKPSKEKSKDNKKDSKDDKKSNKQHKKKSPALSSPASSVGSLKSPPSIIKSPPPPKLSQPIIKQEKSSNKTVIFPSDFSSSDKNSPSQDQGNSPDERDGGITVKHEDDEKPRLNDSPTTSSMPLLHKRDIKVEPSIDQQHPTDISENEIDVTTLSQGEETNYTETFEPNMFFPSKFGEEKKKKKKKKSDKDRDEKSKKKENRDKKDRKRKHENSSSAAATAIPKLTLKMGSEMIGDDEPPSKISNQRSDSPFTSMESTLTPSASQIIKKKKDKKHKQKDKEREDTKGSFYVETLANTSNPYGGEIYYCPGCGLPDDGSPMIGCDSCDGWYHWPCVNIIEEPAEDEKWYCPNCPESNTSSKKKKKKKKKDD